MVTEDALVERGITVVDEFDWSDIDILRPGTDYKNGVTYVTVPMLLNQIKTVGKGKAAKEETVKVQGIGCITSEGKHFPYTPERVADNGFSYPSSVVTPTVRRWSAESMREFIRGEHTPSNPLALYKAIRDVFEEYVEYSRPEYYEMMPLFVMASYHFRLFHAIGYIHFNGTRSSGKSTNLSVIKELAFNAMHTSNISAASLFRTIAGNPGVVCVDEAEGFDGERGEELRRILNSGYSQSGTVQRTEKENDVFIVKTYETYGPKAIAGIAPLDDVIGSRCIIVAMRPMIRAIPDFNMYNPRWQVIRDRLYIWMMTEQKTIKGLIDDWTEIIHNERCPNITGRSWQITQQYIIFADYLDRIDNGDRCDRMIKFFEEYFVEQQKQQDATDRIRLVLRCLPRVLATVHPEDEHFYPLKNIHEVVSAYLEEDQREYFRTRTLGKHLDVLGFKRRRAHKQGQQVWLDPQQVRQEFLQRRVETDPEDVAWLKGEVEYTVSPMTQPTSSDSVWASLEEEPE